MTALGVLRFCAYVRLQLLLFNGATSQEVAPRLYSPVKIRFGIKRCY